MNTNYYFHYTKAENLEGILKNGLMPQVGETYKACSHSDYTPKVFLSRNPDMCSSACDEICLTWRDEWKHSETIMLVINIEGLEDSFEEDDGFFVFNSNKRSDIVKTSSPIEPWRIVDWMYLFRKVVCPECQTELYDYHPDVNTTYEFVTKLVGRKKRLTKSNGKIGRKEITYNCSPKEWPDDLRFDIDGVTLYRESFPIEFKCCSKTIKTLDVN